MRKKGKIVVDDQNYVGRSCRGRRVFSNTAIPVRWVLVLSLLFVQVSCKKFLKVDPPASSINGANVYNEDNTAISVLTTLYANMSKASANLGMSVLAGLSADELTLFKGPSLQSTTYIGYYTNTLKADIFSNIGGEFWGFYTDVYICNSAIEGLRDATHLTPAVRQQLLGEAKFMRAFFYFYLVNLYGDVPLVTSTDYEANRLIARTSQSLVYQQMIADLKDAQGLLSDHYLNNTLIDGTSERVRPTSWAATALLARVYLYTEKWDSAEAEATKVINNTAFFGLPSLDSVFLKNSRAAIWQLQPVNVGWNTEDARTFVLPVKGPNSSHPVYLSDDLLNSFDSGDQRRVTWVDSVTVNGDTYYYPFKYKSAVLGDPVTEYEMVLRLGEQYLIRAEARAQEENLAGAMSDLNAIRTRAGLRDYSDPADKTSLLEVILHERQVELFTESGQRWLDLKRSGAISTVMGTVCLQKGGSWSTNWALYPIPYYEIQRDPNLKQNNGY